MNLKRLEYFTVLSEESSFRLAAERLNISQPALSQQISKLEDELGARLIDRSSSPVSVTPVGAQVLERARVLLAESARILEIGRNASDGGTGTLRVGCAPSLLYGGIPRLIGHFSAEHPKIATEIIKRPTNELIEMLRLDQVDLAFLFRSPDDELLDSVEVSRQMFYVVLPEGHPLAKHKKLDLYQLRNETIVLPVRRGSPTFYDSIIAACLASGFSAMSNVVEGATLLDQMAAVAAGRGVTLVPRGTAESITLPGTCYRPLERPALRVHVMLAWKRSSVDHLLGTAFRDFIWERARRELLYDEGEDERPIAAGADTE